MVDIKNMYATNQKTALIVIGDEILTGRTQDINVAFLATQLAELGLPLGEVRMVPDVQDEIVAAINALRIKYKYVFTTGGIGPTHDDITADAVAVAFDVPIDYHPEALRRLQAHYAATPSKLNEARKRMARMPAGAVLLDNPVSAAPGFAIANVYVLAGVPDIMRQMFLGFKNQLQGGVPLQMQSVTTSSYEGEIATALAQIAVQHKTVDIGSYPKMVDGKPETTLVVRGLDAAAITAAIDAIKAMLAKVG